MTAAHKQRYAQTILQLAELLADRAGRNAEPLGCRLQAAKACGFSEGTQCQQGEYSTHGSILDLENLMYLARTYRF
ncbi:hypothetical protein D9M71_345670 [compost metagenome]